MTALALEVEKIVKDVRLKAFEVDPELVEQAILEVQYLIQNETNRSEVPEGLKYVWVSMVVDLLFATDLELQKQLGDADERSQDMCKRVTSIKEGDTQVNLSDASGVGTNAKALLANAQGILKDLLHNYERQLQVYRRMVWHTSCRC